MVQSFDPAGSPKQARSPAYCCVVVTVVTVNSVVGTVRVVTVKTVYHFPPFTSASWASVRRLLVNPQSVSLRSSSFFKIHLVNLTEHNSGKLCRNPTIG